MMRFVSDATWAILTLWQEARGETYEGKLAVAEVIRNRTARKFQSAGTVASTVLARYQFSGWNTTDPNRIPAALLDDQDMQVKECARAWAETLRGSNITSGAVFYYNPRGVLAPPAWAIATNAVAVIGGHHFFKG